MGKEKLSKQKTQKKPEEIKINSIKYPFTLKKNEIINIIIKDRIIRDNWTLYKTKQEKKLEKMKLGGKKLMIN